ncbi:hypothetical protein ACFIJ5_14085 [Haloimpatiens sp. FM7330]|uniref:hypothetical protein n=1 Tax=Haloimpatiens sp. FM7330 TaxID=3298610 RepID=UPI0036307C25
MKVKKKWKVLLLAIILIAVSYALTYIPHKIVKISPSKVSSIKILDGNTGKSTVITERKDIEHIINNLNSITFKKDKCSLFYMGYSFRTTIYRNDGSVYKKFIINSENTLRKYPFFYSDTTRSIDYDYIKNLIDKQN